MIILALLCGCPSLMDYLQNDVNAGNINVQKYGWDSMYFYLNQYYKNYVK